ncbi:putative late blight resistance protein homolog R1B-16 [Pyrus x bretschneideri]|uniref:putative late blight resistance protein homolog R1B-16 n=1 Tax=Pyrus x bretschneideri TaxID=225117 RepID=UPI00202E6801|nr:putative late blight resistance protein homolog R1B-16 [Pyrus x bretschneideri]
MIAFWAPFLFLHLGGPDKTTAYSLEDNELWLRHLLGVAVQVIVALYVFIRAYQAAVCQSHPHLPRHRKQPIVLPTPDSEEALEVIEFKLGFMYDVFYTKSLLVYSGVGGILRCITLSFTVCVFLAFMLITEKQEYMRVDVIIRYILLVGAIVLKFYAVVIILSSDWTMLWLSKYLLDLIAGDMVQVVERKNNGEVKTCRLPYALQSRQELQHTSPKRLTDHYSRSDEVFARIHGDSSNLPDHYKDLISILSFDTREGNKPGEEIGNFLRRGIAGGFFHQLQVLDLENVFRPELPTNIGKLSRLRYLGLRWTFLDSVPTSIGNLLNLQTLDVKHTDVQTLPSSIWKLPKLRHLYLNQSKIMHQKGGSSLKNLHTLCGAFVDKNSPLKGGLDKLINLRKLGLAFQLDRSEQRALGDKIVKPWGLRSLK